MKDDDLIDAIGSAICRADHFAKARTHVHRIDGETVKAPLLCRDIRASDAISRGRSVTSSTRP
ncbi:hypothetical protein, partial [Mesorhizobium sp.]